MKNIITLTILLLGNFFFAQVESYKKIYLDSTNHETIKENHQFYRIIKDYYQTKPQYEVLDYYADGHIKTEKTSRHKDHNYFIGIAKEYYPSGKIKSEYFYNNDYELSGSYNSYYENGNKEIEGEYVILKTDVVKEHVVLKIISFWEENGLQKISNGNGLYIEKKNNEFSRGKLVNGFKSGIWTGYNTKFKLQFIDQYESGIFLGGVSKNENNEEFGYLEIDKFAEFKGGIESYKTHFEKNYKIPDRVENIKSKVYIEFDIHINGTISNINIKKSFNEEFDKQAIKYVKTTNGLWNPQEYRGIKTTSRYFLPIVVELMTHINYK